MNQATTVNLASDPFRRERAQNTAYAAICAALLCSFLVMLGMVLHTRAQASRIRADIQSEESQLQTLQNEQGRYTGVLARPRNADVFSRSVFLNELIARRAVSWTKVFADLQTVMPTDMRLAAVRLPQVPPQQRGGMNRVQLDMSVASDRPDAVIGLLKRLQASPLFGAASVMSQSPPTQNDPLYKYRVTVAYAQKL